MNEDLSGRIVNNLVQLVRVSHSIIVHGDASGPKISPLDPHYGILWLLQKEGLPMSELGKRLHRSKPNMTAIVNKLIDEGKVKRLPDKDDRRVVRIMMTEKGREFLKDAKQAVRENMRKSLSGIDKAELEALAEALERANKVAAKMGQMR